MFRALKNIFFVLWNITIVVFSTTVIIEDYLKDYLNVKTGDVIGITLFLGVIFFILFLIFYELSIRGLESKLYWKSKLYLKEIWYFIIPGSLLFISIVIFAINTSIKTDKQKVVTLQQQIEKMNREKLSTTEPVVNTLPPPVLETDPMVNCGIHQNCGGGTKYMKKVDCDNSTCCEIGDEWFFYFSKAECNKDQKKFSDELVRQMREDMEDDYDYDVPTYTPPVYTPPPTYTPPTYTPPTYTPPQKTEEEIALEIKECKNDVSSKYANLIRGCSSYGDTSAYDACVKIYTDKANAEQRACEN